MSKNGINSVPLHLIMETEGTLIKQLFSEGTPYKVKEIDSTLHNFSKPYRMDGGAILICTDGQAEITINTKPYTLKKGCEAILLDDMSLFIIGSSHDFRMTMLLYSKEMAFQATYKFAPQFFSYLIQHPLYRHPEGGEETLLAYMKILRDMQSDTHNRYHVLIATNLLRSILLNAYDKIQRFSNGQGDLTGSRKEEIYNRFMDLVIEHARIHRDVSYYADKLCISTKYLAEVAKAVAKETPKQSIDAFIVSEIKLMLTFTDMNVQQIADYLHFPNQSYLGRFFKHHTGMSPSTYKMQEMVL